MYLVFLLQTLPTEGGWCQLLCRILHRLHYEFILLTFLAAEMQLVTNVGSLF
jgi:hypothetical protein